MWQECDSRVFWCIDFLASSALSRADPITKHHPLLVYHQLIEYQTHTRSLIPSAIFVTNPHESNCAIGLRHDLKPRSAMMHTPYVATPIPISARITTNLIFRLPSTQSSLGSLVPLLMDLTLDYVWQLLQMPGARVELHDQRAAATGTRH